MRRSERLLLVGLEGVSEVQGAQRWQHDGGLLRMTVQEGWTEISILGD